MSASESAATVHVSGDEVTSGPARGAMGSSVSVGVLPGVEEEAVEGAGGGEEDGDRQEVEAELGQTRDGGDEDGGGEEDADGELFREAMGAVGARVDEKEVGGEQCREENVDAECVHVKRAQESGECAGGEEDAGEEGAAMTVVEDVAGFEIVRGLLRVERAGVEEAIGDVENPDGDEHRGG